MIDGGRAWFLPSKCQSELQSLLLSLAGWEQGWPMLFSYNPLSASDQEEKMCDILFVF